jgi:hypothetical protein
MSRGPILVTREPITQPEISSTFKAQKRFRQGPEYNPETINAEYDFIHERINNILREAPAIADLGSGATLAEVITRVNLLTAIFREAGLLKT